MSIFINEEVKKNTKDYWFGLATPILIGWGCSLFSLSVLSTHHGPVSEFSYVAYFFAVFWVLGHLVLWPLTAWWLISRAKKIESLPYKNGGMMSIKLYIIWAIFLTFQVVMLGGM